MLFMKANQTLYPDTWNYNACLIIEYLKKIIIDNGGRVKEDTAGFIVNRSILEMIRKCELDAARVRENIESGNVKANEAREKFIKAREKEADELKAIPNEPRKVTNAGYIRFLLDNKVYSLELSDNPFFDFHYSKTPIRGNKYSQDAMSENLEKDWLWDCFLKVGEAGIEADRREAANIIFNHLVTAKDSKIYRDGRRQRVRNTYNSNYHYETVYRPERLKELDF